MYGARVARCMRGRVVEKGYPIPVLLLLDAYRLTVDDVVARGGNGAGVLLRARPAGELDGLVDHRRDRLHARALDERRELDDCRNAVARGPRFVRDHDRVHQLFGPCVLYLEGLLVLESLWTEAAQDGDGVYGMEFPVREAEGEAWTHDRSAELVVD